ncbi:MAG: hypothetical protein JW700_00620, partial [Candidatus Aenigmarchaeota archaeon]|nr:hypothetical protein [Candidatus Aenigmarchaeota archaeon]
MNNMAKNESPSKAWYLVPIFFGILGGIIGYFAVKDDDKNMANKLLILGIVLTILPVIILFGIMFLGIAAYSLA